MKHDAWLRDAARGHYYRNYLADDADFIRAERNREPAYLVAVDYAHESKRLDAEWNAKQRQLLLFNLSDHSKERWLGKSGQAAKWSFCLKVASMAAEQEIR